MQKKQKTALLKTLEAKINLNPAIQLLLMVEESSTEISTSIPIKITTSRPTTVLSSSQRGRITSSIFDLSYLKLYSIFNINSSQNSFKSSLHRYTPRPGGQYHQKTM